MFASHLPIRCPVSDSGGRLERQQMILQATRYRAGKNYKWVPFQEVGPIRRYGSPTGNILLYNVAAAPIRNPAMTQRRFPPPWSVEESETYFVVKDNDGQQLAYVHFDDPRSAGKPLTRDEARRISANIAKLPRLVIYD
jgi:hypothetical protein